MMKGLGLESSSYAVADMYKDFLDIFILDSADVAERKRIEELGVETIVTDTIMKSVDDKIRLAKVVLEKGTNRFC